MKVEQSTFTELWAIFVNCKVLNIQIIAAQNTLSVVTKWMNQCKLRQIFVLKLETNPVYNHRFIHYSPGEKAVLLFYNGIFFDNQILWNEKRCAADYFV